MRPRSQHGRELGGVAFALTAPIATVAFSILAAGCETPPAPVEQLAAGRAAVEQAQAAGAAQHAAAELANARDKLARAESVSRDQPVTARRLAEEAEVDAQLAIAKASSTRAQNAATELEKSTQTLRESLKTEPSR
jgi:hypothetical protein